LIAPARWCLPLRQISNLKAFKVRAGEIAGVLPGKARRGG
jgi:hypothetical protein